MEIKIDPEFKNLIPALSEDEFLNLEQSILTEGCRDAIITWNNTIIDGHNRYAICTKHGLTFRIKEMQFNDRNDVCIWIIKNQFGRRNLETFVRGVLYIKMEGFFQKKALENKQEAVKVADKSNPKKNDSISPILAETKTKKIVNEPIDTREEISKLAGISHGNISKIKEIQREMPAEVKKDMEKKLSSGDLSINQAHKAVRSVKNNDNAGEILKKAIEKTEENPKTSLENAVKEAKYEVDLEEKEKKREEALTEDVKLHAYHCKNFNCPVCQEQMLKVYAQDIDGVLGGEIKLERGVNAVTSKYKTKIRSYYVIQPKLTDFEVNGNKKAVKLDVITDNKEVKPEIKPEIKLDDPVYIATIEKKFLKLASESVIYAIS